MSATVVPFVAGSQAVRTSTEARARRPRQLAAEPPKAPLEILRQVDPEAAEAIDTYVDLRLRRLLGERAR